MNQQSKTSKQRKDLNRWLNCWILPNTWNRININLPQILSNYWRGDFPGFPVIKTLHFHCRGYTFNPWWAKFHMLWGLEKKKKKNLFKILKRKEHFLTHSMSPATPWYQSQTQMLILQEKKITDQYPFEYHYTSSQLNTSKLNSSVY